MKKKTNNQPLSEKFATTQKVLSILKSENSRFMFGMLFILFGTYLFLAFTSFFFTGGVDQSILKHPNPGELLATDNHIQNWAGARGAQLSQFFINDCFGISAYAIVILFIVTGMSLIKANQFTLWKWFTGCNILMVWISITFSFVFGGLMDNSFLYPGGLHGYHISLWISSQIGGLGLFLSILTTGIFIALFFSKHTIEIIRKALRIDLLFKSLHEKRAQKAAQKKEKKECEDNVQAIIKPIAKAKMSTATPMKEEIIDQDDENIEDVEEIIVDEAAENVNIVPEEEKDTYIEIEEEEEEEEKEEETPIQPAPKKPIYTEKPAQPENNETQEPVFEISNEKKEEDMVIHGDISQPYNPRLDLEHYQFPTLDLLQEFDETKEPPINMEEQTANKNRIIQVLHSFGIEISSIKASVGPTITLYEITPAEGVRISKIRNLEDDIALSLSALGIRIIAPIPGKGTIGIEVPNANPRIVPMASILASKKFQETTYELPVALGKTITNEVFMVDLAKAPHMLVAGATGQGKSVGLNAIVTSLLYKKHPSELKFVIIDPKKVEFAIYAPIEKHFLAKLPDGEDAIITDVTKVVQTLNSLCVEMDNRYDLLRKAGCRNIKEYNAKFIARQLNPNNGHRFMPYIVIIIDEFGDLIMTAGKEVELPICRIAQLARAVGIHAIIATQRPTTNIITGTIKANFPARVAFRVASMMDSRTILDRPGAQQLIGKGDMLYLQGNDPVRVQCAFVDTPEVERIANYISHQQGYPTAFMLPEYVDENAEQSNSNSDLDLNRLDPMLEEAARLLIYHQQGSTSLIQRKFSIGYNRAGRIMDQLEKLGIVGPANGSKAREVLCMDENDLQMRLSNTKG